MTDEPDMQARPARPAWRWMLEAALLLLVLGFVVPGAVWLVGVGVVVGVGGLIVRAIETRPGGD